MYTVIGRYTKSLDKLEDLKNGNTLISALLGLLAECNQTENYI